MNAGREPAVGRDRFKRPESVLVLVHTGTSQVLLLRRVHPHPFWQSVTGSLRWGETPMQAACREVVEETGIDAVDRLRDCGYARWFRILPGWSTRFPPDTSENLEHVFRLELARACPVRIDAHEHDAAEWVDMDTAIERTWSWTNRVALQELRALCGC
jgi:dihydroneopterin triphosphate diphosphatase